MWIRLDPCHFGLPDPGSKISLNHGISEYIIFLKIDINISDTNAITSLHMNNNFIQSTISQFSSIRICMRKKVLKVWYAFFYEADKGSASSWYGSTSLLERLGILIERKRY